MALDSLGPSFDSAGMSSATRPAPRPGRWRDRISRFAEHEVAAQQAAYRVVVPYPLQQVEDALALGFPRRRDRAARRGAADAGIRPQVPSRASRLSPDRRVRREEPPRPLCERTAAAACRTGKQRRRADCWDNSISRAFVVVDGFRGRGDPGFAAGRGCPPQRSEGDEQTQSAAYPVFCTICSLRSIRRSAPARPCSVKALP